ESTNRVVANHGVFFSRAEDIDVYVNKYKTSRGLKYVTLGQSLRNPDETIQYNLSAYELLEYLCRSVLESVDETQVRLITTVRQNYDIVEGLHFRGCVGTDFTSLRQEIKRHNDYHIAFNETNSTGSYTINQGRYTVLYSDALLTYSKEFSPDF